MKRPHILMLPLPLKAHIYPILGLCSELRARGYRITCITDSVHAETLRQVGAEPVLFTPMHIDAEATGDLPRPLTPEAWWPIIERTYFEWLLGNADIIISELTDSFRNHSPDLILYDPSSFAGPVLARRLGALPIQLRPHFAYQEGFRYWKDGRCTNPQPILRFAKKLDAILQKFGVEQERNLWRVESLNIVLIPEEFHYCSRSFDTRYSFVGRCLNRPFEPQWKNNSKGKPIILVSDATATADEGYFGKVVDALSGSSNHVILSVDERMPNSALRDCPENFEINRFASHLEILPHASLLICQGGLGGTLEAIYNGVPVIALPLHIGHEEVAYRLSELKLGLKLPRNSLAADELRESVQRILSDTELLDRVERMQHLFRTAPPAATLAADKIGECL